MHAAVPALVTVLALVAAPVQAAPARGKVEKPAPAPATDPAVMAFDGVIKGPATMVELRDAALAGPRIRTVAVPTLALVGQHDALLIDKNLGEATTFDTIERVRPGVPATFEFQVVPDSGHMQCLQRDAHDTYAAMTRWLETRWASGPAGS